MSTKRYFLVSLLSVLLGVGLTCAAQHLLPRSVAAARLEPAREQSLPEASYGSRVPSVTVAALRREASCAPCPSCDESVHQPSSDSQPRPSESELRSTLEKALESPIGMPSAGPPAQEAAALKALGESGLVLVLEQLGHEDPERRAKTAALLGRLNEPEAIPNLIETALNDRDKTVSSSASQSLALMDIPMNRKQEVLEAFRRMAVVADGSANEINAIWALCKHGDPEGFDRAMGYLSDPVRPLQAKGTLAVNLALLPNPELLPIMAQAVSLLSGSEMTMMEPVVAYFARLGTPAAQEQLRGIAANEAIAEGPRKRAQVALAGAQGPR